MHTKKKTSESIQRIALKQEKRIPFDSPKSFSSTLTLKNITNFITKVEDFFDNKVNNNLK